MRANRHRGAEVDRLGRDLRSMGRSRLAVLMVVLSASVGVMGSTADASSSSSAHVIEPDQASLSTRGVSAKSINVVFPVSNLYSLASQIGFAGDPEDAQQITAIKFYVGEINRDGGIDGRKINPIIVGYNPTNETEMQALCKDWTEGNPAAFAVIDGLGAWSGESQLCITELGKTPLISQWTTVTNWTDEGSPYLWWLGPDQAEVLQTVVKWASAAGFIASNKKVGIVVGDRTTDQLALNDYLLPALKRAGIVHPVIETIAANPSESATTTADAPFVVEKFRTSGVSAVIPLIPANAFFPYLQAETSQKYFPRLLLSDYEDSIEIGLGLVPLPFEAALDNQEGVTVDTLGGIDDDRPENQGGYDPGVRSCWEDFRKSATFPFPAPPVHPGPWIEEQGPIASWCQGIRLFAAAARKAGRDLNRRTFVEAMASIRNFAGTLSPTLSYGKDKFYGPTEYRIVSIHNNSTADNQCINNYKGRVQATCWIVQRNWRAMPQAA